MSFSKDFKLQVWSLRYIRDAWTEKDEALDCNVQSGKGKNDINDWFGDGVVRIIPRLINAEADRNNSEDVSEESSEAVTNLGDGWLHKVLKLEAVFGGNASERRHECKQVRGQSKQWVCGLIMILADVVLV